MTIDPFISLLLRWHICLIFHAVSYVNSPSNAKESMNTLIHTLHNLYI